MKYTETKRNETHRNEWNHVDTFTVVSLFCYYYQCLRFFLLLLLCFYFLVKWEKKVTTFKSTLIVLKFQYRYILLHTQWVTCQKLKFALQCKKIQLNSQLGRNFTTASKNEKESWKWCWCLDKSNKCNNKIK